MDTVSRKDKHNYYLDIAQTVLERSTCLRRKFGAIVVKNDEIVATGYNGAPRGRQNCIDMGYCVRAKNNIPRGERYELCRSVHAEANCIISAPRSMLLGAQLYLACRDAQTGELVGDSNSCSMCKRLIINAGIEKVIIRNTPTEFTEINVHDWIRDDESLFAKMGY